MSRKHILGAVAALALALPVGVASGEIVYRHGFSGGPVSVSTGSNPLDLTPDAFFIPPVTDAPISHFVVSAKITPTGFTGTVPITVSGQGTPGIRVGTAGSYTSSDTIAPGQSFEVGLYSSAVHATTHVATVTVGGVAATYVVTTAEPQGVAFTIPDIKGVEPNSTVQTDLIYPSGITGLGGTACAETETGERGGTLTRVIPMPGSGSTNGCGDFPNPGGFMVNVAAPAGYGETRTYTVRVTERFGPGNYGPEVVRMFKVTTRDPNNPGPGDIEPGVVADREIGVVLNGTAQTHFAPQGFDTPTTFVINGQGNPRAQIVGGGTYTAGQPFILKPGERLSIQVQAPGSLGQSNVATVSSGGISLLNIIATTTSCGYLPSC